MNLSPTLGVEQSGHRPCYVLSPKQYKWLLYVAFCLSMVSCRESNKTEKTKTENIPVASIESNAQTSTGDYISWKEHIIDDIEISGVDLSGSDGLSVGDLDRDGFVDIVSVHESDTEYDGKAHGKIRIAFGSVDPNKWECITLAEGSEAAAAEDVAIDDINGDGFLDIVAACELAHLIYFENPRKDIRSSKWERIIPKITKNRGSFIRVFTADLNNDGSAEIIAANKGDQLSDGTKPIDPEKQGLKPISFFEIKGDPLQSTSWIEHKVIEVLVPINSQPVDIDGDGDVDIIGGSRGERRIFLLENISVDSIEFTAYPITISGSAISEEGTAGTDSKDPWVTGFNMAFEDLDEDGKLDIILVEAMHYLIWLEQPDYWSQKWNLHVLGDVKPDLIAGLAAADINNDNYSDILIGGYSRGARDRDGDVTSEDPLGRLAWFENPGNLSIPWKRHDISRRKRGMYDKFVAKDMDRDGDLDFISTRGNSYPYDGVFWMEQIRSEKSMKSFVQARTKDSEEMPLPCKE